MRILQNIVKGIDAAVAWAIRDDDGRIVEDVNEPRRVSLRGEVDRPICVGGANHDERRTGDELAALSIKP
jgi:hypothetical protein